MKKLNSLICFTILVLLSVNVEAQNSMINVTVINQYANDIVYDSSTAQLIISIPSKDNVHGNSLGFIDPYFNSPTNYYYIGSEPNPIALTDNFKYIYAGLDGSGNVIKFDIDTKAIKQTINMGSDPMFGPNYAYNISTVPGNDSTIAVSRKSKSTSSPIGVAIYKNGLTLKDSITLNPYYINVIHFFSTSILYGYDDASSAYAFSKMSVNNNGISLISYYMNLFTGAKCDFHFSGKLVVGENGNAVDISDTLPKLIGKYTTTIQFGSQNRRACVDTFLNLVCFGTKNYSFNNDTLLIERYHRDNFLLYDLLKVGHVSGDIVKMINWGDSTKLALIINTGQVIIINGNKKSTTGIKELNENTFRIYPNPVKNEFHIETTNNEIMNVQILDLTGKQISGNISFTNSTTIKSESMPQGIYFLRVLDSNLNLVKVFKVSVIN